MKFKVKKFGTGRHIILPKNKFELNQEVEINTTQAGIELTVDVDAVRVIVKEEIEKLRGEY